MSNVINLNNPFKEQVIMCPCGCTSFAYTSMGMLRCASCEVLINADIGTWVLENTPKVPEVATPAPEGVMSVVNMHTTTSALVNVTNRLVELAEDNQLVFLMGAQPSGKVLWWNTEDAFAGPERREWSVQRLNIMMDNSDGTGNRLASKDSETPSE